MPKSPPWIHSLPLLFLIACGNVKTSAPDGGQGADAGHADAQGPECSGAGDCASGICGDDGSCVTSQQVPCKDEAPLNATSTKADVTITFSDGGWSEPAACAWDCNANYAQDGLSCINSKQVACTDAAPANATSIPVNVTITYTDAGGWSQPASCAWECNANYAQEGASCINSKQVACTNAAPANATSIPGNVTITYTDAGGWSQPASCAWVCNANYAQEGSSCINSKVVHCAPYSPANGSSIDSLVTITYTDANGWSQPSRCDFRCSPGYCKTSTQCTTGVSTYAFTSYDSSTWFGGDSRAQYDRHIGHLQTVRFPTARSMNKFAFYFNAAFARFSTSERVEVTVRLELRNSAGVIQKTANTVVPTTFGGGWVWWDINASLAADTQYAFDAWIVNGYTLGVNSSMRGHSSASSYPDGYALTKEQPTNDLSSTAGWMSRNTAPLDFNFMVRTCQ